MAIVYIYSTNYSKIRIVSSFDDLDIVLKPYIYSYADIYISNHEENDADVNIYIFFTEDEKYIRKIKVNAEQHEIGVGVDSLNEENQMFIKRLLINVNNRILENKGVIFFHSSSVCVKNQGIMFLGDRGNGKTTNMLYMLNNIGVKYVSNDRTGLKPEENNIKMIGIPSRINIRAGAIESSELLKKRLLPYLCDRGYDVALKYLDNTKDMNCRMVLSIQELKEALNIEETPIADLENIVVLNYDPTVSYDIVELKLQDLLDFMYLQRISGVFSGTKEIEDILNVASVDIKKVINSKKLKLVKVTQNCDNSKQLLKDLVEYEEGDFYDR